MSSQSSLLQVGQQCSIDTCNVQDFLPFECRCNQVYCRDHIFPESHACAAVRPALTDAEVAESGSKVKKCDVEGCNKPTLYAFSSNPERESCEKCKQSHCVVHRYPDTHNCSPLDDSSSKDQPSVARQLLQKNFGSALSGSSTGPNRTRAPLLKKKVPTDPVKLAQFQKIELMKMRHKAIPADLKDKTSSVPPHQRLTVNVRYGQSQKVFWLRKTVSGGRAIDMLSTQLQVDPSLKVFLCRLDISTDEQELLRNDTELGKQIEDGSTLALVHELLQSDSSTS
ncbi:hypothetical protein BKA70DRAFT_1176496 [Coprinopsis sp. MPI-PUGE-AT-0042]|nr:hypothetical protein BKA70DRAFT_1176496 [Coprinopsis sp. MPI-PUGE-AT-0042]